jgi:hypothetical protein
MRPSVLPAATGSANDILITSQLALTSLSLINGTPPFQVCQYPTMIRFGRLLVEDPTVIETAVDVVAFALLSVAFAVRE